jgi:hypothetical protein
VRIKVQSNVYGHWQTPCGEFDQTLIGPVNVIPKLWNIYPVRDIPQLGIHG